MLELVEWRRFREVDLETFQDDYNCAGTLQFLTLSELDMIHFHLCDLCINMYIVLHALIS